MKLFIIWVLGMVITMLIMCSCGTKPQEQKALNSEQWENSIFNKDNFEFIIETAFNENVLVENVTQEMFNKRYIIK